MSGGILLYINTTREGITPFNKFILLLDTYTRVNWIVAEENCLFSSISLYIYSVVSSTAKIDQFEYISPRQSYSSEYSPVSPCPSVEEISDSLFYDYPLVSSNWNKKMYTDSMEQTLYSPVSPHPMVYNESTNYYNGQAFVTPVSPYECRPECERESLFSELRAVDSIIDSTVSVLRQFDSLNSTSASSRDAPVCDTYSMSTTNSVSSACVFVPPPPQDREGRVGGSSSPGSSCSSHPPMSPASVEDLTSSPRRHCAPYSKSKKKYIVPGTMEYNEKRERNNVAVRKSRAKAKNRQQDNERRMSELQMENERLSERLETITKELVVLKGLFKNMGAGVPPGFSKMFHS